MIVQQQTNLCFIFRTCCCQPNMGEWNVSTFKPMPVATSDLFEGTPVFFIQEDAPYVGRCFSHVRIAQSVSSLTFCAQFCDFVQLWPGFRQTTFNVHKGPDTTGRIAYQHKKDWTLSHSCLLGYDDHCHAIRLPCCCLLPYLDTLDENGQLLGTTRLECSICVCIPRYAIFDPQGQPVLVIRPDTCCGCCVSCRCQRGINKCSIAFHLRNYQTMEKLGDEDVAIRDIWPGCRAGCCSRRSVFNTKFPQNVDDSVKATLMGSALLMDMTLFELVHE